MRADVFSCRGPVSCSIGSESFASVALRCRGQHCIRFHVLVVVYDGDNGFLIAAQAFVPAARRLEWHGSRAGSSLGAVPQQALLPSPVFGRKKRIGIVPGRRPATRCSLPFLIFIAVRKKHACRRWLFAFLKTVENPRGSHRDNPLLFHNHRFYAQQAAFATITRAKDRFLPRTSSCHTILANCNGMSRPDARGRTTKRFRHGNAG